MSAPQSAEEKLSDLLDGIRSLAGGYEKLRVIPTGPEIAADIRVLLEIADAPEHEHPRLGAARRRAERVVDEVSCPKCGRAQGASCVSLATAVGIPPDRVRVYPHREREQAERALRNA